MKKLFVVLFVVAVIVIGVGFYRGWFALSSPPSDNGRDDVNVELTLDRDKMQSDANSVKQKTSELTDNVTEGAKDLGGEATDGN